jgi:hypothetical protein
MAESSPGFVAHTFTGQWFFEYETDDAVYAGYKVRAHYLSTAVVFTDDGVWTLLCNSSNMDQKERSIHRKAPLWKGTLDGNIRIELGKATPKRAELEPIRSSLASLKDMNVITADEYEDLMARLDQASRE